MIKYRYHKRLYVQSLLGFDGVNSRYTFVRRLGNSRLSEALISEKNDMIENVERLQHV